MGGKKEKMDERKEMEGDAGSKVGKSVGKEGNQVEK